MVKGIGGSAGYGVGKVVVISDAKPEYVVKNITDTEAEIKRYEDAVASFEKRRHRRWQTPCAARWANIMRKF